uniref:C2H2-type domain-containing protein n=1 Tax=Trichogramma kaykai TaxID=54128 RepID=A0ABD2XG86_9HYME
MESIGLLNSPVRVKEEPSDVPIQNDGEIINESSDLRNVQLLPVSEENPVRINDSLIFQQNQTFGGCDIKLESDLNDVVEIVVECQDVKPEINSLKVEKVDDEISREVKREFPHEVAKDSNLNFDCELNKHNETRGMAEKFDNKRNLKSHSGTVHHDTTHICKICSKSFSTQGSLHRHDKSMHQCITHSCDICGKTFSRQNSLKAHIDSAHNAKGEHLNVS